MRLELEIRGLTFDKLIWGSSWFTCTDFPLRIYPENILKCLRLVDIDRSLANSAVEQIFKLKSLTPLYNVLSDDSFLMSASVVKRVDKEILKKLSDSPRIPLSKNIIVFRYIYTALLLAAAFGTTRVRLFCPDWTPNPAVGQFVQAKPCPCFASASAGRTSAFSSSRNIIPPALRYVPISIATGRGVEIARQYMYRIVGLGARMSEQRSNQQRWDVHKAWEIAQPGVDTEESSPISVARILRQDVSDGVLEQKQMYESIIAKTTVWIEGGKILNEYSPEIQQFRAVLKANGLSLPDGTFLCFNAKKIEKAGGEIEIVVTTCGTMAVYNAQEKIQDYIKKYLIIDNQRVKLGERHETDRLNMALKETKEPSRLSEQKASSSYSMQERIEKLLRKPKETSISSEQEASSSYL